MVPTQRRYRLSFIFGMYLSVYTHVYIAWKFWRFFGFGKWCLNFPCFGSTQKIIQRVTKTNKTFEHSGLVSKVASFFLPPKKRKKRNINEQKESALEYCKWTLSWAIHNRCYDMHDMHNVFTQFVESSNVECGMLNVECWMLLNTESRI